VSSLPELLRRGTRALPKGQTLPPAEWRRRHRWMLALLWVNAAGLVAFALAVGFSPGHALLDGAVVAAFAAGAAWLPAGPKVRASLACLGLLTASAVTVHVSGGYVEAHFHFFVMVVVLALYEDWTPFLLAFAYVVLHHGLGGVVAPELVYNHADAVAHPWKWAGIHGAFVGAAGAAAVVSWRLNEDMRHAERGATDALAHQAVHDALTGLPNRTLVLDRLEHALVRAARHGTRCGVVFVDVDRFKLVNDSLGHELGDELLVSVGERLRGAVREADTIGRLGGDEFVVLLEDLADEHAAIELADRLRRALVEPVVLGGNEHFVTASFGLALSDAGSDAAGLLRDADAAMYRAKDGGGARWELFDEAMRESADRRLRLERDLRRGLAGDELVLHFQPIFALGDGDRVAGTEALVRWQHPERGLVGPGDFVPLAEETGLVVPIGEWVLSAACRQAAAWRRELGDRAPLPVHVNVSARQLALPDLPRTVARTLAATGVAAADVVLEITETALVDRSGSPAGVLRELRELGVSIALDDFGTGYSSLAYLQRFPIDSLKIDRSFVARLDGVDEANAIVTAILGIAASLGLHVVAEGVETPAQLDALRGLGCDAAQGFLLGRPAPAEAHPVPS
jgi:diguanylate cyclase